MVADGGLDGVDRIFALHCDPRLEVGKLGTRVGPITSACDVLEIRLTSPGGHTARPHLTADLVEALGLLITQLPLLLTRQVDPRSGTVLVWGAVQAGEAANAIPQHGVLRGTLRTADHATWGELEDDGPRAGRRRCSRRPASATSLEHIRGVPPVVNERGQRRHAGRRGRHGRSARTPPTSTEQSSGGEDFAWYLEHVPGRHGAARRVVRATVRCATSTSPRSTSTSARSRSASACWPTPPSPPSTSDDRRGC